MTAACYMYVCVNRDSRWDCLGCAELKWRALCGSVCWSAQPCLAWVCLLHHYYWTLTHQLGPKSYNHAELMCFYSSKMVFLGGVQAIYNLQLQCSHRKETRLNSLGVLDVLKCQECPHCFGFLTMILSFLVFDMKVDLCVSSTKHAEC